MLLGGDGGRAGGGDGDIAGRTRFGDEHPSCFKLTTPFQFRIRVHLAGPVVGGSGAGEAAKERRPRSVAAESCGLMRWMGLILAAIAANVLPCASSHFDDVLQQCYDALEANLCEGTKWGLPFRFYRPSLQKYSPDQWLWDSGAHMIVWSHRNASNSIEELRTLLQLQRPDGFVPEEIFWGQRSRLEDDELLLQWSNTRHSDITQFPVLPYSLRAIHAATKDAALVAEFLPRLVRYMQWWRRARDDGDGLVSMLHNWEGLDASPACVSAVLCISDD